MNRCPTCNREDPTEAELERVFSEANWVHQSKLTPADIVKDLKELVAHLEGCSLNMDQHWAQYAEACARIRGTAFNGFRVVRPWSERETRRLVASRRVEYQPAPSVPQKSSVDILSEI